MQLPQLGSLWGAVSPDNGETLQVLLGDASASRQLVLRTIDLNSGTQQKEEKGKSLLSRRVLDKILFQGAEGLQLITPAGSTTITGLPPWVQDKNRPLLDLELLETGYAILAPSEGLERQVTTIIKGQEAWAHTLPVSADRGWIFESLGGRETVQKVFDKFLAVYGTGIAGLTVLGAETGKIAWEYHIPREDYILSVSESASGLWVCGTADGRESMVALIGKDGKVKYQATIADVACRIAPIGPERENRCWLMAGAGMGGVNQIYLWDGQGIPEQVLENITFREIVFPCAESERAIFFSRLHDQYHILSADGTIMTADIPIPDKEKSGLILLHVSDEQLLIATREAKSSGDTLYLHKIPLE